jgi:phosphoglycerate dehydrogenase-like enzyme
MTLGSRRRARVLVCDPIAREGIDLLSQHFDVDVEPGLSEDELLLRVSDYEALVVRSATPVTRAVFERADRLRVVARAGAGLDTIDTEAAVSHDVRVVNSPDANTLAVAELTIGMLLSLARNLPRADAAMKEGRWEKSALAGFGLSGRTLGIVGFGRIGQAVAIRAQAFGMRILTNQHRSTPELYLQRGVTPVDLYELLAESDFVTLHVPARDDTRGLISERELASMRPEAYLVNTSRGSVVDEEALLAALDAGTIAGAALDVFVEEPAVDSVLARHPRVVATPHIGASTSDAQTRAAVEVAEAIVRILADEETTSVLPLRVVELERVTAHETTDPARVAALAARMDEDGLMRNPPIVTPVEDGYVVLDGATRVAALRTLESRHVVVQDVTDDTELGLETWNHVILDIQPADLMATLEAVAEVELEPCAPGDAADRTLEYGGICSIVTALGEGFVVHSRREVNRFDALAAIATAAIGAATVSRTLERDIGRLRGWYPTLAAIIEYPQFTVEQVLTAARSGRLLPPGATRFVVPGRVLRLDLPLSFLLDDRTLDEKNRRLHDALTEKERNGSIRYYGEPVYLLDE